MRAECVCLRNVPVTHEDDAAKMLCLIPHLINYIKYLLDMIEEILSDILFHDFVFFKTCLSSRTSRKNKFKFMKNNAKN